MRGLSCSTCSVYHPLERPEWVHVAVTWDGHTGRTIVYLNGEEVAFTIYVFTPQAFALDVTEPPFKKPLIPNGCVALGHEHDDYCGLFDTEQVRRKETASLEFWI